MKAQFWSFDAIFAIVVFGSALMLITFVWLGVSSQFSLSFPLGTQLMQAQVQSLQNRIVSQGTPASWYVSVNALDTSTWNNISVGLGTGVNGQLSPTKIMAFLAMSSGSSATYQATKQLLGVSYDYYIVINATNYTISLGLPPYKMNPYAVVVGRQSATLNGVPVAMQVILWTNKSFGVS
jgi:hypothetical protein